MTSLRKVLLLLLSCALLFGAPALGAAASGSQGACLGAAAGSGPDGCCGPSGSSFEPGCAPDCATGAGGAILDTPRSLWDTAAPAMRAERVKQTHAAVSRPPDPAPPKRRNG